MLYCFIVLRHDRRRVVHFNVTPYVESFNGKLSDELLSGEIFYTLQEAKVLIERWRVHYNTVRPHSALGYRPSAPEARLIASQWAGSAPFAPLTALRPPTACATNGVGLT